MTKVNIFFNFLKYIKLYTENKKITYKTSLRHVTVTKNLLNTFTKNPRQPKEKNICASKIIKDFSKQNTCNNLIQAWHFVD